MAQWRAVFAEYSNNLQLSNTLADLRPADLGPAPLWILFLYIPRLAKSKKTTKSKESLLRHQTTKSKESKEERISRNPLAS
eukprot:CAMPEP_0119502700 /NCGR_PEP_ID=MMETSP1344-20130328/24087_1 /TAXON_ID=236787 /ORGANISM="Florenciella parvula, Strain CCMP2471" /LENGTH=80 /DNA_ID=CAMNT_0007538931 /DNA_START=35 /DNA_END=277 /DNA_ORIENTATION=+